MVRLDQEPNIVKLFCHYNTLYFQDTLGGCVVSWAEEPLPNSDISGCDYYPGGGGCIILLSKSLYKCHMDSDLKNVLLHEMIHAYMFIKDDNTNHSSDHGANFKKLMDDINSSSVPDPHCESCEDFIESTKVNGTTQDDCIERMGDVCLNSTCQWHRLFGLHKMHCSGSYYKIQESPPYCVEVKGSRERLDECKASKSASGRWHAKHTSNKIEASNKHELEDASAEFLQSTNDAIDNCRKKAQLHVLGLIRRRKKSKDIGFDHLGSTIVQEALKRPRTDALSKNQGCNGEKKRKISKWDGSYSVIVEHVNYYCVDYSDEDEVPLINKRTERRKQQNLLENPEATYIPQVITGRSSDSFFDSFPRGPWNNDRFESLPLSQVENCCRQIIDQTCHETSPSSSDSPIVGEMIDISDD
ncbi:hypothetical protein BRADI_1g69655v3 [Brachypodium distachyon]|uniref:SprT-like domain-containing protein n=1 Tax=Brachypodium distachyon TaxID=15368 RepID=A0A0Q3KEH2_BRADI|nr:hypothetical protein BRADI_1g69655v3 [Brachypodium distachyon]